MNTSRLTLILSTFAVAAIFSLPQKAVAQSPAEQLKVLEPLPPLPPIKNVKINDRGVILVNGKPFFPILSWLQGSKRYPALRQMGFNVMMGNWKNKPNADEMANLTKTAGMYALAHFDPPNPTTGKDNPYLFAWHQADEPDLSDPAYDAKITPGKNMRLNKKSPLARIFDGVTHSWSVLDPLKDGSFSLELDKPVTIESLGVFLTVSKDMSVAKTIVFQADGKEILKADLEKKKGEQKFKLDKPATFKKLTITVTDVYSDKNAWGSIGEITGYDAAGKNVLLFPVYQKPHMTPEQVMERYQSAKKADPNRLVFMTFTGRFLKKHTRFSEKQRAELYPQWVKGGDVVGFDIYPIYGWNKPEWMVDVADGVRELRRLAGPGKPVYAWIETSKGTGNIDYAKQKDVLPEHTRAEVWMAIIAGAKGIGYFTHVWKPKFTEFAPTPEMQLALGKLNRQITRLAPAILAPPAKIDIKMAMTDNLPCHLKATELDGEIYIFAQNMSMKGKPGKGTLNVPGLKKGAEITVVDENRTLTADEGRFTDDFKATEPHIYKLKLK